MVMAGMEMRRLGLVDRPAYVVPNHMLEQFSRELLQLYPQARVLITTRDLTTRPGRKNFVARAATGDWDAVVITHSAFERLPLRADSYKDYTDAHLAQVRDQLAEALEHNGSRGLVKKLEAAVARAETKLERLLATTAKDDGVCFEETGIDYLFVDFTSRQLGVRDARRTGRKTLWRTRCEVCSPRSLPGAWSPRHVGSVGLFAGAAGEPSRRAPLVCRRGCRRGCRPSSC
jgi:N12 class adenine-specific DNA methylase